MYKPYVTTVTAGEFSTVQVGEYIETCYFGNDGSSRVIGRTPLSSIQREHLMIHQWDESAGDAA